LLRGWEWTGIDFAGRSTKLKPLAIFVAQKTFSYTMTAVLKMKTASQLATSMTKTDGRHGHRAFVTLRFAGDELDPSDISKILEIEPKRAHRRGEEFVAGPRAGRLRGKTGMWYIDSDGLVDSDALGDHLRFLYKLLYPAPADNRRVMQLRDVLTKAHSAAHVTCYWHGEPGEQSPMIPAVFAAGLARLPADIETDFEMA
jgi:hypothetical protein